MAIQIMARIESSVSFPDKLRIVAFSGLAGVIGNDPKPRGFNEMLKDSYRTSDVQYRSPRASSNPPLEILEAEMCDLALVFGDNGDINKLPWTEERFSQGLHLATMVAFLDQHQQPIPYEQIVPDLSREFVDRIRNLADIKDRQITLAEQFDVALGVTDGSILGSALIAHSGARSIARRSDTRADPRFNYSNQEVMHWRDCVASFEAISGVYDDPPAETYHFWGTFVAGLLSEHHDRFRDRLFNPIYRKLYTNAAEITEVLRFKIARKNGVTHKHADVLGYHLGSMVASATRVQ